MPRIGSGVEVLRVPGGLVAVNAEPRESMRYFVRHLAEDQVGAKVPYQSSDTSGTLSDTPGEVGSPSKLLTRLYLNRRS